MRQVGGGKIFVWLALGVLLYGCTFRFGSRSRLDAPPAPTSLPLPADTGQPSGSAIDSGETLYARPGFVVSVFAEGLQGPRMMALGPDGQIYVAERGAGRILRLVDGDGDGVAEQVEAAAEGLSSPSSLAFFEDGSLYIAETTRILRLQPSTAGRYGNPEVIVDGLPEGGHHTRTVLFSPDWQTMYVSVGSSCNVCQEEDERRAAILRYDPDGANGSIYARGLRNAVGLAIRPGKTELWATNNGRDMLGDDLPPETVYRVEAGQDYGWPACHAGRIVDPEFGSPESCEQIPRAPVEMQAHTAPLGLTFYGGDSFPEEYRGDLFVALHGSWNRSQPVGYEVVRIPVNEDGSTGPVEVFVTGWLVEGNAWGRPVDVITGPDGSLYISDDGGGRIFRVSWNG